MGRPCRTRFTYFFQDAETAINAVLPTRTHVTRLNDITSVKNLGGLNMSQTWHMSLSFGIRQAPVGYRLLYNHSAPSFQCLIAVHNEIYDIASCVMSYILLARVAAEEFALSHNRTYCDCNCFYINVNNLKYCMQKFTHLYISWSLHIVYVCWSSSRTVNYCT
jgi:hypothetical protein